MCAPVRNDKEKSICFEFRLASSRVYDTCARSAKVNGVNDHARRWSQKTLQIWKAVLSIQYLSCQAQERYWAQRSVRILLGRKKSNGKDTFFLFPILSFSCKRKNGRRKKNAIQDRFALFHSAAFGGTHGGLLRNAACPAEIRRRADDIRPYKKGFNVGSGM